MPPKAKHKDREFFCPILGFTKAQSGEFLMKSLAEQRVAVHENP
jgi:hypothetical protein